MPDREAIVDGLGFEQEKKQYILDALDPILEEMVADVVGKLPAKPVDFMISWLQTRGGISSESSKAGLQRRNEALKQELQQTTASVCEALAHDEDHKEDESEEEGSDDECDEIPESFRKSEASMSRARASVSAEAYGTWNEKKAFDPPVHPKSDEQKERLKTTLMKSFMFAELEPKDLETILMAMKECPFEAGQKVITEGEDGDYLFVIESGSLECVKNIDGEDKVVKTCNSGDVFGELALLYNCPRAANVIAKDACVCWQLDRESFNHIVKDAAMKRREKYDTVLKSVPLLSGVEPYERSQIADALKAEVFSKGDYVVRQDEPGDKFYIIEEGELYAVKNDARVLDYKAGACFGELALLKNQPRAASVIVESETCKVLALGRASFNKMVGPLGSLLNRQVDSYSK